jgi:APA family basic amino acid/polyamine antiporter
MIVFIAVNMALIWLRIKEPQKKRPFKTPLSVGHLPLLPVLAIVVCLIFLFQFDQLVYFTSILAFVSSAGVYFLCRYYMKRSSRA